MLEPDNRIVRFEIGNSNQQSCNGPVQRRLLCQGRRDKAFLTICKLFLLINDCAENKKKRGKGRDKSDKRFTVHLLDDYLLIVFVLGVFIYRLFFLSMLIQQVS